MAKRMGSRPENACASFFVLSKGNLGQLVRIISCCWFRPSSTFEVGGGERSFYGEGLGDFSRIRALEKLGLRAPQSFNGLAFLSAEFSGRGWTCLGLTKNLRPDSKWEALKAPVFIFMSDCWSNSCFLAILSFYLCGSLYFIFEAFIYVAALLCSLKFSKVWTGSAILISTVSTIYGRSGILYVDWPRCGGKNSSWSLQLDNCVTAAELL